MEACGIEKFPGVYGRVSYYQRWINTKVKVQSEIYVHIQTIQMKLILLYVWADWFILGSARIALKLKYEI